MEETRIIKQNGGCSIFLAPVDQFEPIGNILDILYILYTIYRGRLLDDRAMLDDNVTQQYQIRS